MATVGVDGSRLQGRTGDASRLAWSERWLCHTAELITDKKYLLLRVGV